MRQSSSAQPIHSTETDGVRTLWAVSEPPLRARLVFRVGTADEQPTNRGITRLLQRVALHGNDRPDHAEGHVTATALTFDLYGSEAYLVDRLASLSRRLGRLPASRPHPLVDAHRPRFASRADGMVLEELLRLRYGNTGYGTAALPEVAEGVADVVDLNAWSRRFATRQNAVLMLTGPPPRKLRLKLADGAWQAPPDPRASVLAPGRTAVPGGDRPVALHSVVTRSWAASAACSVLRRRLIDELRTGLGVANIPRADYERMTADVGDVIAVPDELDGRANEAAEGFLRVLFETLEASRAGANEPHLAWFREMAREDAADPLATFASLTTTGWDLLHGGQVTQPAEALAEALAVDDDAVAETLQEIVDNALLRVPDGVPTPDGWQAFS